jgi:deoxyguanosine kinase
MSLQLISQRVEICGGIASGKTTLAGLISNLNLQPVFENFKTNPFWKEFFSAPGKFAFETEISFMLQHYHEIKRNPMADTVSVCDYSFILDIAYAEIGLEGSQLSAFQAVYDEIKRELSFPALLIHLRCDEKTELKRIRNRARQEENSITLEFLDSLNKAVERQVEKMAGQVKIVTIDSAAKNFVEDEAVKQEAIELVGKAIDSCKQRILNVSRP